MRRGYTSLSSVPSRSCKFRAVCDTANIFFSPLPPRKDPDWLLGHVWGFESFFFSFVFFPRFFFLPNYHLSLSGVKNFGAMSTTLTRVHRLGAWNQRHTTSVLFVDVNVDLDFGLAQPDPTRPMSFPRFSPYFVQYNTSSAFFFLRVAASSIKRTCPYKVRKGNVTTKLLQTVQEEGVLGSWGEDVGPVILSRPTSHPIVSRISHEEGEDTN